MNYLIQDGDELYCLTPHQAQQYSDFLSLGLRRVDDTRASILRQIDECDKVINPERQYEEWGIG